MGSGDIWTSQSPVEKITPEKNRIMKTSVIIAGLLLVLVANILVVYYTPYGFYGTSGVSGFSTYEGFKSMGKKNLMTAEQRAAVDAMIAAKNANPTMAGFQNMANKPMNMVSGAPTNMATGAPMNQVEGFESYYLENAGGAKEQYAPVGAFDGVKLSTGNNVSDWRYTAPNEKLMGPEFSPDSENLFMFKNNQCKPECCGASFSCGGGCVCTTPQQRQYIAGRGGNRTEPEDSA
jgi:hypothetical protein